MLIRYFTMTVLIGLSGPTVFAASTSPLLDMLADNVPSALEGPYAILRGTTLAPANCFVVWKIDNSGETLLVQVGEGNVRAAGDTGSSNESFYDDKGEAGSPNFVQYYQDRSAGVPFPGEKTIQDGRLEIQQINQMNLDRIRFKRNDFGKITEVEGYAKKPTGQVDRVTCRLLPLGS